MDDELAKDVSEKFKTLDDLKKDISRNMEVAKNRKISEIKSQSLLEQLIEKNPFEIPASMLAAELDGRWRMMAQQFQTTPEQLKKMIESSGQTTESMLKEWTGDSEKMLRQGSHRFGRTSQAVFLCSAGQHGFFGNDCGKSSHCPPGSIRRGIVSFFRLAKPGSYS